MHTPPPGFEHAMANVKTIDKPSIPHTCRNCGLQGHLYKDCPHPIMSFGIICYRMVGKQPEYLMIQRKDSLSFMEFIRGKYKLEQLDFIETLISCMTHQERTFLQTKTFEELWNIIWYQPFIPKHTHEYHESKKKFETLKVGFMHHQTFVSLHVLLEKCPSPYAEPEWGFPKGRRKLREADMDCAVREFCEETGFHANDISVIKEFSRFEEIFFGTNNVLYRHVYYIACLQGNQGRITSVDPSNINQAREVRAISWFSFQDAFHQIRPHNNERRDLFKQVHCRILEYERVT